jgi:DNA-directed RNA polymerase specialized sigma24 family protein
MVSRRTFRPDAGRSLTGPNDDGVVEFVDRDGLTEAQRRLEAALLGQGVNQRGLQLLRWVDGEGISVTEAARRLGIARETAQRELGKARRVAQAEADQWRADGRSMPW